MIKISSDDGEFTIEKGDITTESDFLKYIFESLSDELIPVFDGDVDRALGIRMMKYLTNTKIEKFTPTELEKGILY